MTLLSKAVLGAVFTGLFVTLANLVYDYVYRDITNYAFSEIINVPSLIFFSMLTLLVAGVIYFVVKKLLGSDVWYMLFFVTLTVVGLFIHLGTTMPNGAPISTNAHGLTIGVFLITGLAAAFVVPYMARHSSVWSST